MARDDDDDDRPRKKKRPSEEIEDDARPVRKRRPAEDDDDDDRPRKRRPADEDDDDDRPHKRRRMDEDEEEDDDLGNSPLGAVVPLGTSVWALISFYLALLSCVLPLPLLGFIAILLGVTSFFRGSKKTSYGSITGNIRAILGILIGLVTMIGYTVVWIMYLTGKLK